jgi:hypothetical protein
MVGGLVLAAYVLAATTFLMVPPFWCITLVQQRIPDLSGFDFEIGKRINCEGEINVMVSKAGESKKALIFRFLPADDEPLPTVTSIDDGTVQISIPRVPFIWCRKDKWDGLVVKYDTGVVDHRWSEPDEC